MTAETYITYRNLRGTPATREEFRSRLKLYDRRQLMWLCAAINFSLDLINGSQTDTTHRIWVRRLFPQSESDWILRIDANVFHRHQLLFLLQEAAQFSDELGEPPGTELPLRQLGELFLMANDQLNIPFPDPPKDQSASLSLTQMLLPSNEANLFTNAIQKVGRAHLIVAQIAESRRTETTYFDIRSLFEQATGVSYETFRSLMIAVFTRLMNVPEALQDATKFGIDETYFGNLSIPPGAVEQFFTLVSTTPDELRTKLEDNIPRPNDFRLIRDRPLLKIGSRYYPLDAHIGFEKFETGVFWSILSALPKDQKRQFAAFWGAIFEDYVIWLLQQTANQKLNNIIPNPRYSDDPDQQVCDVIVQCDRVAIFIEIKGNTITADAKYSGSLIALRNDIEKKWVGYNSEKRGVTQLVPAIKATCVDDAPRRIKGFNMDGISTIIPLIITRDEFGGYMGVNTYLNERFKTILGKVHYRKSITPLVCICADSLEKLTPYLRDSRMSDILSVRLRGDKKLSSQFFADVGPYLRKRDAGDEDRLPTILRDATFDVVQDAIDFLGLRPSAESAQTLGPEKPAGELSGE